MSFLLFIIGVVLGQVVCRLLKCGFFGMFDWKNKLITYLAVPVVIGLIYFPIMSIITPDWKWGIHYIIGLLIGFVIQLVIMRVRKEYYEELLEEI